MYCLLLVVTTGNYIILKLGSKVVPVVHSSPVVQSTDYRQPIITKAKAASFFSVCADEAIHASNKEQLPLVLRYIDSEGQAREDFIEFILCDTGTSGRAIADKIVQTLQKLSLDVENLRG